MLWLVDGNNVVGAAGDGWWNDPPAAAARLLQSVAEWCRTHGDDVLVVFDGRPQPRLEQLAGGNLAVGFARRSGRDAADDRIVELVDERYGEEPSITVVTSDRGLVGRLPPGVAVEGAGTFRRRLSP